MVLTSGIGTFATLHSYDISRAKIDAQINGTIMDAVEARNQELSAALFHIDEFSLDFTLALLSRDGSATIIKDSTVPLFDAISLDEAAQATESVQSAKGITQYRYRSLLISGGDYLLIAASSNEAVRSLKGDLLSVLLITLLASLVAFAFLSLFIRRLKRRDDVDALRRMQEFLGDASHELRTPLTVIKGYVEMLSKGQMSAEEDKSRAFNRVTNEISRMEALIHDLLLLAELGESAAREQEEIDVSLLLRGYAEDFSTLNPVREIDIEISDEIFVVGVRDYFTRFIQNALNNISRHTATDVPVRISLAQKGKNVTLIIEDGGNGLPESAYREKVRSLNRFDKSRSRESGGSGLGMSIMAAVVEKLHGQMTLRKSELGGLAVIAEFTHGSRPISRSASRTET
ncbi:MAG: GHKL domain-containing protein [Actinobacteria bacterium]|nr:GHKL domain-containing protein [Actinomycetota bacterium]